MPRIGSPFNSDRKIVAMECPMSDRLIRMSEVTAMTSLARSTIYKYIQLGEFPQKKGGLHRVALWRESEVQAWIAPNKAYSE